MYLQRQDDGPTQDPISAGLGLVSDADTIRENIVDEFTCDGRGYGYYADVANDCQLFHVCYPVQYPDGQQEMFKWSFICPNQTIFDQVRIKFAMITLLSITSIMPMPVQQMPVKSM